MANDAQSMGEVTCPTGTLLVLDMGLLAAWSHDEPHDENPDMGMTGHKFVDLQIAGADAARAAALLAGADEDEDEDEEDASIPLYDVPEGAVAEVTKRFAARAKANELDARLEVSPARVPHGERVRRALAWGLRSGEVPFSVGNAIFVRGLPADRKLKVVGTRLDDEDGDQWASVSLVCSDAPVARREKLGSVLVEQARLMFTDLSALAAWEHEESLDGLTDIVFWGREAERFVNEPGVTPVNDGQFGWLDLSKESTSPEVRAAIARVGQAAQHGTLCVDVRPHSHHHAVLKQVWSSPTESGSAEVGGATVCGFMTSWGDGVFDVFEELDEQGALVRVTVEFQDEDAEEEDDGEDEDDEDEDENDEDEEEDEEEEELEAEPARPDAVPADAVWKPSDREWELGAKRDGHEVGPYVWWRPDGSVVCRSTYNDAGLLHGVCRRFHPDGTISMQAPFDGGRPHGKRFHTRSRDGSSPEDMHMNAVPNRDAYRFEQLHVAGMALPYATLYEKAGLEPPRVDSSGRVEDFAPFAAAALPGTTFFVEGGKLKTKTGEVDVPAWTPLVLRSVREGEIDVVQERATHTVSFEDARATLRLAVDALAPLLGETMPSFRLGVLPDISAHAAVVKMVAPNGPAAKAGLRPGDRIERILGEPTPTFAHCVDVLRRAKPGSPVAVTVRRGEETVEVSLAADA